jgi:hypothetical protein
MDKVNLTFEQILNSFYPDIHQNESDIEFIFQVLGMLVQDSNLSEESKKAYKDIKKQRDNRKFNIEE